jgi:uncharacterized membrane protein
MNVQVGITCENQALCDQVGAVFGYLFLGLLVCFVVYIIIQAIKNSR